MAVSCINTEIKIMLKTRLTHRYLKIISFGINIFFSLFPVLIFAVEEIELSQLKSMSMEQLANMEVSIASKIPQSVEEVPAAVFVITSEDIRRSTVNSVPELLRMVPGINVARIDASHWAVSSRGFNGRFSNKLLILMDGRTVYSPLFSGVYWNVQDTILEDIERIEIIRGPGASVWGANAVNGVINIITRSATDTQGYLASVSAGNPETINAGFRYGGSLNEDMDYRIFTKFRKHNNFENTPSTTANDNWRDSRIGFRIDGLLDSTNDITLQGDIYRNKANQTTVFPSISLGEVIEQQTLDDNGGNILARWGHTHANSDQTTLQVYYDYQKRQEANDKRHTLDIDFQYQISPIGKHSLVMGAAYRLVDDKVKELQDVFFLDPEKQTQENFSAFIQDEIQLNDKWSITLGSKFEHSEYTGFEVQPSARLLWQAQEHQFVWASVSRTSRTPSRVENSIHGLFSVTPEASSFLPVPLGLVAIGNKNQDAETLHAYELGYRMRVAERLSFDISTFYNDYSNLRTLEEANLDFSHLPSHLVQYVNFDNKADGKTWGAEFFGNWKLSDKWRIQGAYSFLETKINPHSDSTDISAESVEDDSPKHQLSLQLAFDPANNWETDMWLRYTDEIKISGMDVPHYWSFDARIGWQVNKNLALSLVGQNIFDSSHIEFNDELGLIISTELPRAFYVKAVWDY